MPRAKKPRRKSAATSRPSGGARLPDRRAVASFLAALGGRSADPGLREAQDVMYRAWDTAGRRSRLALAQPLDMAGVAHPRVELHRLHPHPSGHPNRPEDTRATDFYAAPAAGPSGRLREGFSLRRSQGYYLSGSTDDGRDADEALAALERGEHLLSSPRS